MRVDSFARSARSKGEVALLFRSLSLALTRSLSSLEGRNTVNFFALAIAHSVEGVFFISSSLALACSLPLTRSPSEEQQKTHRLRHRLELERVPARVPEEHRPLFSRLPLKPQMRLQLKLDSARSLDSGSQLVELGHRESQTKVGDRHRVSVDCRGCGFRVVAFNLVANELVTVQVEVDPGGAGAALGAAQGAVEWLCLFECFWSVFLIFEC